MPRHINPPDVAGPFGAYSHAVEVPARARTLHVSGQVGADRDGSVPDDAGQQAELVFENLARVLAAAGMAFPDLVRLTYFVRDAADLAAIRAVRDRVLNPPFPASSLVVVQALGRPEWRLEVEALAARMDG